MAHTPKKITDRRMNSESSRLVQTKQNKTLNFWSRKIILQGRLELAQCLSHTFHKQGRR
jgi:hypothetical protein